MPCEPAGSSRPVASKSAGAAEQLLLDLDLPVVAPKAAPVLKPAVRPSAERLREAAPPPPAPREKGFPLQEALRALVDDIRRKVPLLAHLDPARIAFTVSSARSRTRHGTYAFIMPLRFQGGTDILLHGGHSYRAPKVVVEGREMLYLVYLLAPRFFQMPAERKLETILHELYHIDEEFDGDLRRFAGRNWAHGASRKQYDETVCLLSRMYRNASDGRWPEVAEFLRHTPEDYDELYGGIRYPRITRPRLRRVSEPRDEGGTR